jgi:hypothetical protein
LERAEHDLRHAVRQDPPFGVVVVAGGDHDGEVELAEQIDALPAIAARDRDLEAASPSKYDSWTSSPSFTTRTA